MSEENVISNVEDNSPKNAGVVEKVIEIFKMDGTNRLFCMALQEQTKRIRQLLLRQSCWQEVTGLIRKILIIQPKNY